jgi:hypothetical protein
VMATVTLTHLHEYTVLCPVLVLLVAPMIFVVISLTAIDKIADSVLFLPIPVLLVLSIFGCLSAPLVTCLFLQYQELAIYGHNVHGFPSCWHSYCTVGTFSALLHILSASNTR